jgi:uncharacterized repeat protein (TIGR03803 family)
VKGKLFGTTYAGGVGAPCEFGCGTAFSLNRKTGAEAILYFFCSQQSCADGEQPMAGMIDVKKELYGTTQMGGAHGGGAVFSIDRATGAQRVVYSLGNFNDGDDPQANLLNVKGALYGTTASGGQYGYGTVFSVDAKTGAETVIHSFEPNGADGFDPEAGLISVKGVLYGLTYDGGAQNDGALYSIDLSTGTETVLHSFAYSDGANPVGALVDVKGTLFGSTEAGGAGDERGVVFSYVPQTGTETVVHGFCEQQPCTDGADPNGNLIEVNGNLYGTTAAGGANDEGTVFALTP